MLANIKTKIASPDIKRLFLNFLSMASLQGANYILPLIILPYLVRVLGVEYFGLWSFAMAVMTYFILVVDYGFELTATKAVSMNRDDKNRLTEIFGSVLMIKFLLILVTLFALFLMTLFIGKFNNYCAFYYLAFGMVIGQALFPVWFFLGMEKMVYITVLNIGAKAFFTVLLFIFVKSPDDLSLVALFNSLGYLLIGVYSLYIVKKRFGISFKIHSFHIIKKELIEGWYVFSSRIAITFYSTINIIFLGFITNDVLVGYYSIAEKILVAVGGITYPLLRVLYPYFAKIYKESKERFFRLNKNLSFALLCLLLPLSVLLYLFGYEILFLISGKAPSDDMLGVLRIFSFIVLLYTYGGLFTQMLITMDQGKVLQRILVKAAFVNVIFAPVVIYLFEVKGLALWVFFISLYTTGFQGLAIYKTVKNRRL